jgi:diguanylate cyclase (GGDEF)-like protein
MLFRNFIRTIQNGWRWVLMFALLGLTSSLLISLTTVPLYRSSASFLIYPNTSLVSSRDVVTSLDTLGTESVSKTYLEIFNSKRVFKDTVDKLGIDQAILSTYRVSATVTTGSNIELSVSGPDPQFATFLANNIGQNGINYIKSIYQVFDIAFLDQASEPTIPYAPQTMRDSLLSILAGLVVGMLMVVMRDNLRAPLEALRLRAVTDKLSGAFIQRHFKHLLEQEIVRNPTGTLSMGVIQLEGLDEIYEALPKNVLANLLPKITTILRNQLRGNDFIGLLNKSTFSVMMPATPSTGAVRTLERIKQALSEEIIIDETREKIELSPCIGWTSRLQDETAVTLEENALKALDLARTSANRIAEVSEGRQGG